LKKSDRFHPLPLSLWLLELRCPHAGALAHSHTFPPPPPPALEVSDNFDSSVFCFFSVFLSSLSLTLFFVLVCDSTSIVEAFFVGMGGGASNTSHPSASHSFHKFRFTTSRSCAEGGCSSRNTMWMNSCISREPDMSSSISSNHNCIVL